VADRGDAFGVRRLDVSERVDRCASVVEPPPSWPARRYSMFQAR
jgi:hypothetical protein